MADGSKLATAYYELVAAAPGAEGQITKAIVPAASSAGDSAGKTLGQKLSAGLKSYAAPIAAALGAVAVGKFVKDSVSAFNDLAGSVNSLKRITGGSVAEVSSLRGAMQLSGMDASKADTSLTIFSKKLQAVQGDSKKTAAMQDLLGTSIRNSDGSMKSMNQLLPGIADKFKSMPDGVEKTALAQQLFGKSGMAMVPFLNKGAAGISELEGKAKSLGLTLDDQSIKTWGDYRASIRGVQTTMQGLKVTVGAAVLPVFTAMNNFITTSLGPGIAMLIGKIKESSVIPQITSTFSSALGTVASTIGPLIPQLFSMASGTSMVGIVFQALGTVLPLVLPLLQSLGQLAVSVLQPVLATLTPIIAQVGTTISNVLAGAITMVMPMLTQLTQFLQDNTGIVVAAVAAWLGWKAVSGGIALYGLIAQLVTATTTLYANTTAWVANKVALIASKAQSVALAAMYAGQFVAGVVRTTAGVVAQTAAWVAHGIALAAVKVAMGVATAAQWLWNAAMSANPIALVVIAITALVAALVWFFTQTTLGQQIWSGFMAWLQTAWQAISDFFSGLWSGIVGFFQAAVDFLLNLFLNWTVYGLIIQNWQAISDFFVMIWNGITSFIGGAINAVGSVIGAVLGAISGVWNSIWSGISGFFMGIWNGIVSAVQTIGGVFQSAFSGIAGFVQAAFSGVIGAVKGPINGVIGIVNSAIRALNGLHVTIPDWVPGVGGQTWGINIPSIPALADGATVLPKRGGTLAMLAEAGRAETVVDTGKMNALMDMVLKQQDGGRVPSKEITNYWHLENNDIPTLLAQISELQRSYS